MSNYGRKLRRSVAKVLPHNAAVSKLRRRRRRLRTPLEPAAQSVLNRALAMVGNSVQNGMRALSGEVLP